jgi:hypothetical protein
VRARLRLERLFRGSDVAERGPSVSRPPRYGFLPEMPSGGPAVGNRLLELRRGGIVELCRLLQPLVCAHSGCF